MKIEYFVYGNFRSIVELIVCNELQYDELTKRKFIFNHSSEFVDYLKKENGKNKWFQKRKGLWNQRDDPPFVDVLTVGSIGYAFNLLSLDEIFNADKLVVLNVSHYFPLFHSIIYILL